MSRLAVVLFNLGGPDSLAAVRPFLTNLFSDPAILGLPWPLRGLVAGRIAARRTPTATEIYRRMGGCSPLLAMTREQAVALASRLGDEARVFVAMRYWHPLTEAAVAAVADYRPDTIVLLPLYPQYSGTTSGSSLRAWRRAAERAGLASVPTRIVCCYPTEPGLIAAEAELVAAARTRAGLAARVLFSAHGLPRRVIERGDPYQMQIEKTAAAIAAALNDSSLDWRISYQSRVGPLEWIGPATDDEIRRAGVEGTGLVVVPIAFVSEHSETLVELDIDYGDLARESGVPVYVRVPAVGTHPAFIEGLARLVRAAAEGDRPIRSEIGGRICAAHCGGCAQGRI